MKPYTHRFLNIAVVIAMLLMAVSPTAAWAMPAQPSSPAAARQTEPTVAVRLSAADYRAAPALTPIYAVDYGDFVWLEIPASQVSRLEASGLAFQRGETTIGSYSYKFDPVQGEPFIPASLRAEANAVEPGLYLIQFIGPINDHWLKDVSETTGVKLLQYYAHNAYLVWGTGAQVERADSEAYVRWTGIFQPAYKINSNLEGLTGRVENVAITFYNDGNLDATLAAFKDLGGEVVQAFPAQPDKAFYTAIVALGADRVTEAARLATVWAMDYSSPKPGFDDENATQIVAGNYTSPTSIPTGYYNWLTTKGVNGNGVTWADVDTGLNATHPDITGRAIAFVSYPGAGSANVDTDGHGTHTAGAIMGDGRGGVGVVNPAAATDPNGFYWGTGMAPSSTLVVQNALMGSSWPPAGGWQLLSKDSVTNGAVGSSNSWYTGSYSNDYTAACRTHDLMVRDADFDTTTVAEPIIYIFSAGNGGPNYSTLSEPHAAKNPVTVGAATNYPRSGVDINGLAYFSSRGPATDGRLLPSVTAPGYQTASLNGSGTATCGTTVAGAGSAYYNYCSGTSMAAPLVAGSSALIVDWWKQINSGAVPSPALVKALLINSGDDMVGGNRAVGGTAGVIGNLPNNDEGWGRVNLNKVIRSGVATQYFDQQTILGATGETWQKTLTAADPTKPVKVSLVWTDAAGAAGANPALVNDLNLTVVNGGNTYRGNNFLGGWSTMSNTVDNRNNLENVYLPAGTTGALQITISGANIAGDGVPYNADITDQDFALVVYNARADGGTIAGMATEVTDAPGDPIVGAKVTAVKGSETYVAYSEAGGLYSMFVPTGTYNLNIAAYGYLQAQQNGVNVTLNATTTQNFALAPAANYVISGTVRDSVTLAPLWATVNIAGAPFNPPVLSVQTNPATGFYSLTVASGQSYTLTVSALLHTGEVRGIGDPTGNQTQNFDLVATTTNGGLAGWVQNYYTTQPISGALVSAGGAYSGTTNAQGYYEILGIPAGYYTVTASAALYSPVTVPNLQVQQSNITLQDFLLPTSHMEYAPTALQRTVTFGTIVTDSAGLVITNTGLGALTFDLAEQPGGFAPQYGEGGGPDPYGYMWKSSSEAGGPTFNWIDATGGTALGLADDGEANITSPFAFPFYGVSSTALRVGNNGGIFFNATTGDLSTANTAMSSAPNNSIMTFWDDIDSDTGDVYWTVVGSAPNRRLVVEWYNRPHYSNIGSATFEAVLFEDGDILYQYLDTDFGNASYDFGASATVGIRGGSATNLLQHSFDTAVVPNNYAVCFDNPTSASVCGGGSTGSGALPWLNQVPISGTLAGGSTASQNIAIGWNAAAPEVTQPGLYTGSLKINNNDPVAQNVVIPVEMTVSPSATQGKVTGVVSSTGYCGTDIHPLANITVTLTGSGGYSKTLKTDANGGYSWWVDTANNSFTINAVAAEHSTGSANVTVIAGTTPNVQNFTLTWLKPCVGNDPSSVSVTVQKGLTATAPLTLSNGGAATLNFDLQERDGGFAPVDAPNAVDILVVGANTSSNQSITQALTTIGYSYLITTEAAFNTTPVNDLLNYSAVIYASSSSTGLPNLVSYLDAGGNLLVADNDLGYSNGSSTFYTQYLQATYGGDDATAGSGSVVGEDIMSGINADLSADPYPDYYTINGANTTRVFVYSTTGPGNNGPAGSRTTRNSYNAVYLPFDIYYLGGSAVGDPVETEVIQRALGFLAPTDVTWFSESPISGTIAVAGSQPIEIAFDSSVPEVTQPGLYTATLLVKSNDPVNNRLSIPVSMNVTPLLTEGKLIGTATSLGYCDANPAPLANANVLIQDAGGYSYTLNTNASGQYGPWWLNSGSYTVTVSAPEHPTTPAVVIISAGVTTTQDFNLRWLKPCVGVNPDSLSAALELGASTSKPLSLTNGGAVSTTFDLVEVDGGFEPVFMAVPNQTSVYPALETRDGNPALAETGFASGEPVVGTPANPSATTWDPWETMAPMPAGRVFNAVVAAGNYVYVIGGTSDAGGTTPTNTIYRYNTATNTWDSMANAPDTLNSPDGIAIGGKIYIPGDDTTADTFVYDIASNTWSTITANGGYTARSQYQVVAIGNKLYVLGGIVAAASASTTEVWILDTAAGTWSAGVPMQKSRTSFSAAAIDGQIYVAGGVLFPGFTPDMTAEKFNGTSWSYVAGVPNGGGAYTRWSYNADGLGKDGLWLAAGRREVNWTVLNHAGYYDPVTDTWTDSPTIPTLTQGRVYMEGDVAADGYFYVIGGRDSAGSIIYTTNERMWVGYAGGGGSGGAVVWLNEDPISGTLAADIGLANINVTFDASTVAQPGEYYATLNVKSSDPQHATYGVPVTMTVTAPATYGKLMGTVNGLQRCDVAPGTALADTDLVIEASNGMTWTTSTDTGGAYSLWLSQSDGPYSVTAAHTGYATGSAAGLVITGQMTTTHNFDLRLLAPCASVPQSEVSGTQMSNQVTTHTLNINNAGAGSLNWNIQEAGPTSAVSAPSGSTSRVRLFEPNVDQSGWFNALLPLADIIADGSFEAGSPNPYWDEYSSNFGSPLCTSAACGGTGGGTGPHTGTWWAWFGGIDTAVETGYVTQTVVITASSAATLTFWLEIPASSGNDTDWMVVKMDNTPIFTVTDTSTGYNPYAQVSLNVSAFANGQPHVVKFESTTQGGTVTNFFVDDVVLDVTAGGPPPVGTCQAEAIPWLTAVPVSGTTPADSGSLVNLVFNSTGLVSGVYTGTLCVNTSDVGKPQVLVPVEMTVANAPVCDFTSSSPDDLGQTTAFNNLTIGDNPLIYRWDFGDGSPLSAAISPTHQYAQVGLYTVVMTATNNEGVDVCSGQVSIESVPIPSFTTLPTKVNQPMVFNNTTLSNPPVTSWQWNFGDPTSGSNNFSFAQSPTHTYSAAGTYTVTLIATNLKGLAQYQSAVLVVPVRIHLPLIMK